MTRRQEGVDRALYIMHFDHPDGHVWHYAGVTEHKNLRNRLYLHRKGTAFPRTMRARELGFECTAVQHEINADPWREKVAKHETVARHLCELCAVREKIPKDEQPFSKPLELYTLRQLRNMTEVPRWDRWR